MCNKQNQVENQIFGFRGRSLRSCICSASFQSFLDSFRLLQSLLSFRYFDQPTYVAPGHAVKFGATPGRPIGSGLSRGLCASSAVFNGIVSSVLLLGPLTSSQGNQMGHSAQVWPSLNAAQCGRSSSYPMQGTAWAQRGRTCQVLASRDTL